MYYNCYLHIFTNHNLSKRSRHPVFLPKLRSIAGCKIISSILNNFIFWPTNYGTFISYISSLAEGVFMQRCRKGSYFFYQIKFRLFSLPLTGLAPPREPSVPYYMKGWCYERERKCTCQIKGSILYHVNQYISHGHIRNIKHILYTT